MGHVFYQPVAPGRASDETLAAFWAKVQTGNPGRGLSDDFQVRWIGMDDETTTQIFDLIRAKDKTGTFTLPAVLEHEGLARPQPGAGFVLTALDGTPTLGLQITDVYEIPFGEITEKDTAVDGTPVRPLEIWKPLHTAYWTPMLDDCGLPLTDDTPVLIEKFDLIHDAEAN